MEILQNILDQTELPLLTAFILGLMTAVSPCPLATNITAMGYIAKDLQSRSLVFRNGLVYVVGRAFSYTLIGLAFYFSASELGLSYFFQVWGGRIIGPLLLLIGLFMLDLVPIRFPSWGLFTNKFEQGSLKNSWRVFLMGMVFALAFCPYSGVLYFGMLIPLTMAEPSGLALPVLFAIGTGLPVALFAWMIAYTVAGIGKTYQKIKILEKWFRRGIAIVFIGIGIWYTLKLVI